MCPEFPTARQNEPGHAEIISVISSFVQSWQSELIKKIMSILLSDDNIQHFSIIQNDLCLLEES